MLFLLLVGFTDRLVKYCGTDRGHLLRALLKIATASMSNCIPEINFLSSNIYEILNFVQKKSFLSYRIKRGKVNASIINF